jgi:hypothetical protein
MMGTPVILAGGVPDEPKTVNSSVDAGQAISGLCLFTLNFRSANIFDSYIVVVVFKLDLFI